MTATPNPSPTSCADLREALEKIACRRSIVFGSGTMSNVEAFNIAVAALEEADRAALTPAKPVEGDVGALIERLGELPEKARLAGSFAADCAEAASALASLSQQLAEKEAEIERLKHERDIASMCHGFALDLAKKALAETKVAEAKAEQLTAQLREAQEERDATDRILEARAAYFDRAPSHRTWEDAARSYRATINEISNARLAARASAAKDGANGL